MTWNFARIAGVCLLISACADTPGKSGPSPTTNVRGVDSGTRQVVDNFYSVEPDCSNPGYPEIRIVKMPAHGTAVAAPGEAYPSFPKDNVRYECNKKKVATSQVSYESQAGYHGKDSFTIQVRFANSNLRLITYSIDVL